MNKFFLSLIATLLFVSSIYAQESVGAFYRINDQVNINKAAYSKTTALSLPFFEDFTNYETFPNPLKWKDALVYINNTFPINPISRGVATFDGLNAYGVPYDSVNKYASIYADSLSSQQIDLSSYTANDSIYLSFYYQPGGYGFEPDLNDSLMLFFKLGNGLWNKVWAKEGASSTDFKQVLIPITNPIYLTSNFQFRFINKVTMLTNDDHWHVDYIKINSNRTSTDTLINDLAFARNPDFLLSDYTHMPYNQFQAAINSNWLSEHKVYLRNNTSNTITNSFNYKAKELSTGLVFAGFSNFTTSIPTNTTANLALLTYTPTYTAAANQDKVVFEQTYYTAPIANQNTINDTVVTKQVFDNYLAYDDGSAEKSYYLNLFNTLPGKIAIEHQLFTNDTLRGLAIQFGRQIPTNANKYFSIAIMKTLAGINGAIKDSIIYKEDFFFPRFRDSINGFWIYTFSNPVYLPVGSFYVSTIQPAMSGSDSLYFGLDANRTLANHQYYNVLNTWQSSQIDGALMIRPLLGKAIVTTSVATPRPTNFEISISPNPAHDHISLQSDYTNTKVEIYTILGNLLYTKTLEGSNSIIPIATFQPGQYFVRCYNGTNWSNFTKLIIE
ncbi:MAG: T9SS type A sorting domain-containing protein [Bacteroidota bacterium]|nr:T9SS type A sorting domain-containing protein [Bacteroidota bacterium]